MASNDRNELMLSVRFNSSIPRPVKVNIQWTVLQLKKEISKVHNVPLQDVKLVFQGKEVIDNMVIEVTIWFLLLLIKESLTP